MKAIAEVLKSGLPIEQAKKALILLHGRGGTAVSMLDLAKSLVDPKSYFIAALQASNRTWYPLSFLEEENKNEPFLSTSIEEITQFIKETEKYISKTNIFIVGFSQGACLALEIAGRNGSKYGGIIAFTGGLIGHVLDLKKYQGNFEGTQIYISNGDQDPFIPLNRTVESKEILESLGGIVTLQIFERTEHMISSEEIDFVKRVILV